MFTRERLFELFPVKRTVIYFNNASVAPISSRVARAGRQFIEQYEDSGFLGAQAWHKRYWEVRKLFAKLLNAVPEEIAFVKNTSEGISIISNGIRWKTGDNVVIPDTEFPANVYPWMNLAKHGVEVKMMRTHDGHFSVGDLEAAVDNRTRVFTVSSVQFSNGFRCDLKALGDFCKMRGIYFFVDAIQSLGSIPIDVRKCGIDFLTADGHKWLLSIGGLGGLYISARLLDEVDPTHVGWRSVEDELDFDHINFTLKKDARKFEEGTPNGLGIVCLGAALDLLFEFGIDEIHERIMHLGLMLMDGLESRGYRLNSPKKGSERSGIISFWSRPQGLNQIEICDGLREEGIYASIRGDALRLSPHFYNDEEEIGRFFEIFDWLDPQAA